ncbi:hypothetical protein B5P53_06040 [Citrobacter portucalensis]|uniref:hypothetical protein n=1 Tax=Citrobacter portucalensis TaxID=1639133 RepID=UPI0009C77397|nr:hypothetical protein [Citrobacter portucalensis]OPX52440.1 hypothetical protein B5P53_06040 [Citrobacter portucalensis]
MSEVKIYTVVSDELSPPVIGESFCTDMVRHSDYAALEQKLTDMAVQLATSESKCRDLAAENAGLKNPDNWLSQSDYGYEASEDATQNGATEDESLRAGMIAIINRIVTPATDDFLAEVRAQGLESGVNTVIAMMNHQHPAASQAIDILKTHAAQLRKGVQP